MTEHDHSFLILSCKTCGRSELEVIIFDDAIGMFCPRCKKAVQMIPADEMVAYCKMNMEHGCDECGKKPEKEKKHSN